MKKMKKKITAMALAWMMLILCGAGGVCLPVPAGAEGDGSSETAEEYVTEPAEEETGEETAVCNPEGDNAELARDYIGRTMPRRLRIRASRPSGSRLAEWDKNLYDKLQLLIGEVAAGERESTEFRIPYEDVFPNTFTAEELDVSVILEGGSITQEAKDAAMAAMKANRAQLHPSRAVICLATDLPYELYWYDKSIDQGTKISYVTSSYAVPASGTTITVKGEIIVRMSVSEDYAIRSLSEDGQLECAAYLVNTLYGSSAQAAADNAALILDANRDKSDEEKLEAYRDAICALTEYNSKAAKGASYGDPWQMIWVFDGKPNTMVVCEGYAKAFQYLCDLGTAEATAISVQGSTGGAHMWNIVSLKGHQYLADLTNYDQGFDLFLKGYEDGSVETGYTIRHQYGTLTYVYSEQLSWSEEDLTLYSMDYQDWKARAEKAPEIQRSSDTLYPGYAAEIRLIREDEDFPATALLCHRIIRDEAGGTEAETAELPETENGCWLITDAGEYRFTVIRDGAESAASETYLFTGEVLPEEGTLCLPAGAEIQEEAFAGAESISTIEAENCVLRHGAFTGSGVRLARLKRNCVTETGAFDAETVLCLDAGAEWTEEYRFLIAHKNGETGER